MKAVLSRPVGCLRGSVARLDGPPPCLHRPHPREDEVVAEGEAGEARQPTSETRAPQPQNQPRTSPKPARPTTDPGPSRSRGPLSAALGSHPADRQAAAIQAIADQLPKMQQDANDFQAAAAKDREADWQEMLRWTAVPQPTPDPVTRSHPCRGFPIHQPTSGSQPGSFLRTLPRATAHLLSHRPPAPRDTQCHHQASPPDLLAQTSYQIGIRPTRISALHSLLFLPNPSVKSTSGDLGWTPSFCSKWQNPPQLCVKIPTPQSILRGVGLADPSTTGGLNQKASDNPPLTGQCLVG